MSISGPLVLLVGPLVAAVVVGLLGRWRRATAVAGAIAAGLLWLLLTFSSPATADNTLLLSGRTLALTEAGRGLFQLLLPALGGLFLLALWLPAGGRLPALCLAALSPLAAALMAQPRSLGALFLVVAAALVAMAAAGGSNGSHGRYPAVDAVWRYLVIYLLALPLLLVAGWQATVAPAALPQGAPLLLAGAAIILGGGFPVYIWVRPLARQLTPWLRPFVFGLVQGVVALFIWGWLAEQPGWAANEGLQMWLTWSGAITALIGGLLAVMMTEPDDLWASLLLLDMGLGLWLFLLPVEAGWATAVTLYGARFVGLGLVAVGWLLRAARGRKRPWGMALWLYGSLTLVGLPLTVGFGARWALLSGQPLAATGLALLALLAGLWAVIRQVQHFPDDQPPT